MDNRKFLPAAVSALVFFGTLARADELDDRVKNIAFFTPAASVVALMGRQPDAEETTVIAGIPKNRWRWSASNGRTVVVTLIEGRVVMTKTCTAIPDC